MGTNKSEKPIPGDKTTYVRCPPGMTVAEWLAKNRKEGSCVEGVDDATEVRPVPRRE